MLIYNIKMSIMDTFGRLPTDILKSIMNIYTLPLIDVVEISPQNIEMQIKYLMLNINISMIPWLVNYVDKKCIL